MKRCTAEHSDVLHMFVW